MSAYIPAPTVNNSVDGLRAERVRASVKVTCNRIAWQKWAGWRVRWLGVTLRDNYPLSEISTLIAAWETHEEAPQSFTVKETTRC